MIALIPLLSASGPEILAFSLIFLPSNCAASSFAFVLALAASTSASFCIQVLEISTTQAFS